MLVALIADVHSNKHALDAVKEDVRKQVGKEVKYWCLGDIVGYGPHPEEGLGFLREKVGPRSWVLGNHDAGLVGLRSTKYFREVGQIALDKNRKQLQGKYPELWGWCQKNFNEQAAIRVLRSGPGRKDKYILVHGSLVASLTGYNWPWSDMSCEFQRLLKRYGNPKERELLCLLCGHTHIPSFFQATIDDAGKLTVSHEKIAYDIEIPLQTKLAIINPGSVGWPRDGDNSAAYAILDTLRRVIIFRRVGYDPRLTALDMRRWGYPSELCQEVVEAPVARGLRVKFANS
jgi:predicted phosphodiesterase